MDLFELQHQSQSHSTETSLRGTPLAERLRPQSFAEFFGQKKVLHPNSPVFKAIQAGELPPNLILWGPPGTGKTTFAHLLATQVKAEFVVANAVETGAKRLRELGEQAHNRRIMYGENTLLFIDEIHRLNRAQQDVLLPFAEKGDFCLVGATTENPSYELNSALLSRCRVLVFEPHSEEDLKNLLQSAFARLELPFHQVLSEEAQQFIIEMADGDARRLLNWIEQAVTTWNKTEPLDVETLKELFAGAATFYYDKDRDEHYDTISAFIKSIRGSDADAGLYYMARMLEAGEDPVFVARRLVILASEDVGNADPRALSVAVAGLQAVELVGMPEAAINLAQVVTYLASAPKSNRSYEGWQKAKEIVQRTGRLPIPKALRSARTKLTQSLGYGKGYKYSHNSPKGFIPQQFLPDKIKDEKFYEPSEHGFEKTIREYQKWLKS